MASLKRSLEKLMTEAPAIAEETKLQTEDVERVFKQAMVHADNNKRQPKPPPPEGGISIRAAGRKYGIAPRTISGWVQRGLIPILLVTRNEKYIDETILAKIVQEYKKAPGQGKFTIRRIAPLL